MFKRPIMLEFPHFNHYFVTISEFKKCLLLSGQLSERRKRCKDAMNTRVKILALQKRHQ